MPRPTRRSFRRPALLTALVVGASLIAAVPAAPVALGAPGCKVKNVRTGATRTTLQAAVTAARGGDTLEIRGTCVGSTEIPKALKLVGVRTTTLGKPVLDGNLAGRVLKIGVGRTVSITGLTIKRGSATDDVVPAKQGGGIYNAGTLTLTRTIVRDSGSEDRGGGIYTTGKLTLGNGTRVINNLALFGGGVFVDGQFTTASLVMTGDARIVRGAASKEGGGVYAWTGTMTMKATSSISESTAGDYGGGVLLYGSILDMYDTTSLHDNSAGGSGAIEVRSENALDILGRLRMHEQSSVYKNSATLYAAAIGVEGRMLMEGQSVVRNNTIGAGLGAVELWAWDPVLGSGLTMKNGSRIRNNTSGAGGAGLYIYDECGGGEPTTTGVNATRVTANTPAQVAHHPVCG
jgi:predicted outer membrane repeat protein